MSEFVIDADGLSKQYRLGVRRHVYHTLRESLTESAKWPVRILRGERPPISEREHIWALRDVSFKIKAGEVVGIIGHNGSGKSTLLKLLSRITEPTTGSARICGRVGSLLEVGTGFHPELTGRENIFLNGAILGMRRAEIARKFDEIVAFAEVEQFVDTPVKRYSSGMYLRLAFSVAAHLEPEILLVDEVLAVGDVVFQRKCVAKMNEVARQGQTVLFVSHNLGMIKDFCSRGLLLRQGQLLYDGRMLDCIAKYTRELYDNTDEVVPGGNYFSRLEISSNKGELCGPINNNEELTIAATFLLNSPIVVGQVNCHFDASSGEHVVQCTLKTEQLSGPLQLGLQRISVTLPCLWLAPDAYTVYLKFIGTAEDSSRIRFISEHRLMDLIDSEGIATARSKARLLPSGVWTIGPAELPS